MTIWLLRHGKTAANEAHLYCGSTDLPLSEKGREELKRLRPSYVPPENCRFATSGMLRTEQTLQILFDPAEHQILPDLREVDFGAFEMKSYEQLRQDMAYQEWLAGDNEQNTPPDGESGTAMAERAWKSWQYLQASGDDWIVVSHGGVIAGLMARLFPEAGKNRYEWQPQPGCGWCLRRQNGNWDYSPI